MKELQDRFGRRFEYLRLSITDVCNFRCRYCLPDGYKPTGRTPFLGKEEIGRVVRALAGLGMWKVRITGGEPTVRKDFMDIAEMVARTPGVDRLAMTTNGYKLPERAESYRRAGISAINVSIDSLQPETFAAVTGHDRLAEVQNGVDACLSAGFDAVKLNAVLLRGVNEDGIVDFLDWTRDRAVSVRFIELMRTGDNEDYFRRRHLPASIVEDQLHERGWQELPRQAGAGPARNFSHPDHAGTVGLIAPYSKDFCTSCNRLRVSARGDMHLCLFGAAGFPLRDLLQSDDQLEAVQDRMRRLVGHKRETHGLHDGDPGGTANLASIGG